MLEQGGNNYTDKDGDTFRQKKHPMPGESAGTVLLDIFVSSKQAEPSKFLLNTCGSKVKEKEGNLSSRDSPKPKS